MGGKNGEFLDFFIVYCLELSLSNKMPTVGFEPTTTGLKGQQTAIVLSRHGVSTNLYTEKAFKPLLKLIM